MHTATNNTEPTAVITTRSGNLQPQQISHVKTFKNLGGLQIVLAAILVFLSLVDLIGMAFMFIYLLPTLICSGWFVMTGCLPICMSEYTESSLKCRMVVGMSPSQPCINSNAPGNQIQATNMLSLIDTTGKIVPHPGAQQYNFDGGIDQEFGYPQNPNVSNSYSPIYINA